MEFDFAVLLVSLTVLFGLVWAVDRIFFHRKRLARAAENGEKPHEPWPVDWARSLFPVVLVVLLLRSFVAEPFRIPSGSMMPTLKIGDFILVSKFSYGLRLPISHAKIVDIGEPERGDIVVFRPPWQPDQTWIKRIVGVPGDRVVVKGEKVWVNGKLLSTSLVGPYQGNSDDYVDRAIMRKGGLVFHEQLGDTRHKIIETPAFNVAPGVPGPKNPAIVPKGCYFVMGDNRDDSEDSRYEGCVPEQAMVGKAFVIWFSLSKLSRIGTILH